MRTPAKDPDPRAVGAMCRWCPFSKAGAPVKPVFGEGPRAPEGLIFAESPGHEEISRHRLLVGATGQEFDRSLLTHKLLRSKLYLVNVIACQPTGPKSQTNMQRAAECCRPLVLHQIHKFGPEPHVLALGKWAWFSLTGLKIALRNGRGFLRPWKRQHMEEANVNALNKLRRELDHVRKRTADEPYGSGGSEA